jgi:hypothetical protein
MKFLRSTLFATATVLVAAACGDKVTVQGPTTTTPKVNSVSVSPATATLNIGDKITMTAAVNADVGVATTVTWSSSGAAATVDAGGVVTAVSASPGIAICATSTVNTSVKGCGSVVIAAVAPVIPASVSISSITATGNTTATVNPANVAGAIDFTLNVNPGNQTVQRVVLVIGTGASAIRADSQVFTAAQSAALRSAADLAIAQQTTFPQIIFSVNTAAYTAATGAPKWLNGPTAVSAQLYTKTSTTAPAATAAAQTNLTFNNVDGFIVTTSTTGNTVVSSLGFRWQGNGSITINAKPVMYSGFTVGGVTAGLGGVCGALTNGTTTTPVAGVWSVTRTYAATQSPVGCVGSTPNVPVVSATDAAGNALTLVAGGVINSPQLAIGAGGQNPDASLGIRWDNVAPAAPVVNYNPNGRANNWMNDAVVLNGLAGSSTSSGSTSNSYICNDGTVTATASCAASTPAPTDAGVGGTVYAFKAAAGTTVATVDATTAITSPAGLAGAANNASYCGFAYAADALGNTSPSVSAANALIGTPTCTNLVAGSGGYTAQTNVAQFGVDRYAPVIAFDVSDIGGTAQSTVRVNAGPIGGNFAVNVVDTGVVGNSGMLAGSPVKATVTRRDQFMVTPCVIGGTSCAATFAGSALAGGVATTTVTAQTINGYYTYTVTAYDAAGNTSATLSETIVKDNIALVATTPSVPATVTGAFTASSNASDDLDVRSFYYSVGFTTALIAPTTLRQPDVAVNGFNATPLLNTNIPLTQSLSPYVVLQGPVAAYSAVANLLTGVNVFARGQAGTYVAPATQATVVSTAPASGISLTNFTTWATALSAATVCDGTVPANCTGAVPLTGPASTTITASATGTTAIFSNPFAKVDFYIANGTDLVFIGSSSSPSLNDNGATRVWAWTLSLTPGTTYGAAARNVYAFGANSTGLVAMTTAAAVLTIAP